MDTGLARRSAGLPPLTGPGEDLSQGSRQREERGFASGSTNIRPSPGCVRTGPERGDRRSEYLLVIYPSGELRDRLLEEQQQFSTAYAVTGRGSARPALAPHIALAAFQAAEGMEDTLIRWIQRICHRYRRFELSLNNYNGIPPQPVKPADRASPAGPSAGCGQRDAISARRIAGTIYLRVQDPEPFRRLMQQLKAIDHYVRSSGCPPIHVIERPYLCIAGGLTEQVYDRAMPEYSRKTFHGTFPVDELVLLKRNHPFDPCRTVNIFRLLPEHCAGPASGTLPHL
ncbi:MAG TPA: hypothetical protein VHE54_07315 [Puia sp.]|nr:hypothetical protein [Puia sp.]